ncbi:MAG: molybdenum cofactor guanylyltransferase [Methanobacteriota archaeon]|nr:MAG: molybdenum cofactor guanylyltransferase [Euryarchaeota archaeon]
MRSAIILVGGEARRAGGKEKYFFRYRGQTFIERLIGTLRDVVDEIVIVAKDPAQCERFSHIPGVVCVSDERRGLGPIGGLHAGAQRAHGEYVFVAACDMPCISQPVIELLFSRAEGFDAAIPAHSEEMYEPLHAVYRLEALRQYLERHEALSLRAMVRALRSRYVSIEEIRTIDPALLTFTNINKLEDLIRHEGMETGGH